MEDEHQRLLFLSKFIYFYGNVVAKNDPAHVMIPPVMHQGAHTELNLGSQVLGFALSLHFPPALMLWALTSRNLLAGCWNFPSISQIRVSRWAISSETFTTASSCTLEMARSRSASWVRRRRSWSFKNWCNCSNSHTIFFPSFLVFSCQDEREKTKRIKGAGDLYMQQMCPPQSLQLPELYFLDYFWV